MSDRVLSMVILLCVALRILALVMAPQLESGDSASYPFNADFAEEFPVTPPKGLTLLQGGEASNQDRLEFCWLDFAEEP